MIALGLGLTIAMLVLAVTQGFYIGWPLIAGYAYFVCLNLKQGRSPKEIYALSKEAARPVFIVIPILLLIGAVVSLWMASGTVSVLVYYSLSLISPPLFILCAFLLSSAISMLLGTAFGTVGTIGVILMVLARGSGVDVYVTAGAIISGIYVGDRCSPMSSAMYLLSSVTGTEPRRNLRMLLRTTALPFLLTAALYLLISPHYPLLAGQSTLQRDIAANFHLSWLAVTPALLMMAFACLRMDVKISMLASALSALLLAIFLQGVNIAELVSILLWGYYLPPDNVLAGVIHGGGIWPMAKTALVLLSASCFTGMLEAAGALTGLRYLLLKPCGRFALYLKTVFISLLSLSCGCNQSIGIIFAGRLMQESYQAQGLSNYDLARDVSYTAIPMAAIIPWNTAGMVPMLMLGFDKPLHLPFLFYPLMLPLLCGLLYVCGKQKSGQEVAS